MQGLHRPRPKCDSQGLSPKENREIPPLKYPYVYRLKQEFAELEIVINGGFSRWVDIEGQLGQVDGS